MSTVIYVVWRDILHADALLEATWETKNDWRFRPIVSQQHQQVKKKIEILVI